MFTEEVISNGPFNSFKGNMFLNYSLLVHRPNEKTARVVMDTRGKIPLEHQGSLDDILFDLRSTGVKVEYIQSSTNEFDPGSQVSKFSQMETLSEAILFNAENNLNMTDDEIATFIQFKQEQRLFEERKKEVTRKITERFKAPRLPFVITTTLDLDALYGHQADAVRLWMNDSGTARTVDCNNPQTKNVLRLSSNGLKIEAMSGRNLGVKSSEKIVKAAIERWTNGAPIGEYGSHLDHGARIDHSVQVYKNHMQIGCQAIPRAEIERIAKLMNWA